MSSPPGTLAFDAELVVSRLGLGAMKLTGPGTWGAPRDPEACRALVRRARELGVDFFDTADAYGPGASEEILRDVLRPYDGVVVATKGGHTRQGPSLWRRNGRPDHLREACHASLRRLGVDCIDLYQLHAVDPEVPIEESLGALVELQSEGKIRHLGVCNVSTDELARALVVAPLVSVQNRFSLLDRGCEDVLDVCERRGLAFVTWAPLGGGRLPNAGGALARVARKHGATRSQVALAWILHHSRATIPIPGTRSLAHLEENVAGASLVLEPDDLEGLEEAVRVRPTVRGLARDARARARRLRASRAAR
jgi:aryl-alcohol dehydrogenase-like predicted oxidoreductase